MSFRRNWQLYHRETADILGYMYIPAHFAADEQAVDDLLTHHGAADLITATPEGGGRYYAAVRL